MCQALGFRASKEIHTCVEEASGIFFLSSVVEPLWVSGPVPPCLTVWRFLVGAEEVAAVSPSLSFLPSLLLLPKAVERLG